MVEDSSIIKHFSGKQDSNNTLTELSLSSDDYVDESTAIYRLQIQFRGGIQNTSCVSYGVPPEVLQSEIDSMFDYDGNGIINEDDSNHVSVSRVGDGSILL